MNTEALEGDSDLKGVFSDDMGIDCGAGEVLF